MWYELEPASFIIRWGRYDGLRDESQRMECLLERLDKGHDLLGVCLGFLRYIGIY